MLSSMFSEMKSEAPQNSPKSFTVFQTPTLIFLICLNIFQIFTGKLEIDAGKEVMTMMFFFVGEN